MNQYTSINRIFAKVARDYGDEYIVENDVIEWCGEALEAIGSVALTEEAVAFIEVQNHECTLPAGIHFPIIQIARNNHWVKKITTDPLCPKIIKDQCCNTLPPPDAPTRTPADHTPSIPVVIDCNGQPLDDYDLAYYRPYFDLQAEYYIWTNTNYYRQHYSPVRLSQNSFFDSVAQQEDNSIRHKLYEAHQDEYKVILGSKLRFSFKEGSIALAYNRTVVDEVTGYPLIPDTYSHTEAISRYIKMKILDKMCFNGREGACGKADKAAADWTWYCGQAGNLDMMPKGVDDYQDLLDQRQYLLPRKDHYFGFFGRLAQPEQRVWNDPDRRNVKRTIFRGN